MPVGGAVRGAAAPLSFRALDPHVHRVRRGRLMAERPSRSRSSSSTRSPGSASRSGRCSARSSPSSTPRRSCPTAPRFHGRHQLNRWPDGLEKCVGCELCAWACPADAIYVEGASNSDAERRRAVQPRRALRPRLPDQLPALHPVRAVHRGLPHARPDDDQRVRAGRQQPRGPDLREVRPPRPAAARHGAAAARDAPRRRRERLLPQHLRRPRADPLGLDGRRGRRAHDRLLEPGAHHGRLAPSACSWSARPCTRR